MTNQRPTVPSPEQVDQWFDDAMRLNSTPKYYIARQAALWSADHELEECCKWLECNYNYPRANPLRIARRPKPPTLKEQALEVVTGLEKRWDLQCDLACLRRALEALPND